MQTLLKKVVGSPIFRKDCGQIENIEEVDEQESILKITWVDTSSSYFYFTSYFNLLAARIKMAEMCNAYKSLGGKRS